jgi:FkbM family methyltransferase
MAKVSTGFAALPLPDSVTATAVIQKYGRTFHVRPDTLDEYIVKEIFGGNGAYAKHITLEESDVWLDIGGNIGVFALSIFDKVNKVVSYEPEPENCRLFRQNIASNHAENIRLIPSAITPSQTEQNTLYCNNGKNKGAHSVKPIRGRTPIKIETTPIAEALAEHRPNKVKLDAEGAEVDLIPVFDFEDIDELMMEYHFALLKDSSHSGYYSMIRLLKTKFAHVNYNENPKKNWHTLIHCKKIA